MVISYGMPYMGSKNKIAEQIIDFLPPAEHFYDLFGGGGAMTHCALLSGKYKYVHYNEFEPLVFKAFKMAINGEFKNEDRWISHEDFDRLWNTDPYVALCFSFGNCLNSYCYGKDTEPIRKAMHYGIVYNDPSLLYDVSSIFGDIKFYGNDSDTRYRELTSYLYNINTMLTSVNYHCNNNYYDLYKSELERCLQGTSNFSSIMPSYRGLKRIRELEVLKQFKNNLFLTNDSYENIPIETDSVIYCDPPYINTKEYIRSFDHNKFYEYCLKFKNIFISEYTMPEGFYPVLTIKKFCSFSSVGEHQVLTDENLYSTKKISGKHFDLEW